MLPSDGVGAAQPARLELASRNALLEITVVGSDFRPLASGLGRLDLELPAGLYQIVLRAGPAVERRLVSLEPGQTHAASDLDVPFPSAAPVAGSSTTHEYHMDLAQTASQRASDAGGATALVIVVRDPRGTGGPPLDPAFLARLELRDADGQPVPGFAGGWELRAEEGAAAWHGPLEPGAYLLRVREGSAEPIDASLWMQQGWQTVVFLTRDASGSRLSLASVHMVEMGLFWSPSEDGVAEAAELASWALREGRAAVPREALDRLLGTKFRNPMFGIIGAHALLLARDAEQATVDVVLQNLDVLVPGHPDLVALHWMAEALRADRARSPLQLSPNAPGIGWPPMLRASYAAMIRMDAEHPGAIVDASLAERVAGHLVERGIWTTWRPLPATVAAGAAPAPGPPATTVEAADPDDTAQGIAVRTASRSDRLGALAPGIVGISRQRHDTSATGRVAHYLATVAELEGPEGAEQRLAAMSTAELAIACQLPSATVERSLDEIARYAPPPIPHGGQAGGNGGGGEDGGGGGGGGGGGPSLPIAFLIAIVLGLGGLGAVGAITGIFDQDPTPSPSALSTATPTDATPSAEVTPTPPTPTTPPTTSPSPTPGIGLPMVDPVRLVFEEVVVGFEGAGSVTVTNGGDGSLVVASPMVTGLAADDYTAASDCGEAQLPTNGSCTVDVTFRPSGLELRAASLLIQTEGHAPIEVALIGIGRPEGGLKIEPTTINYGSPEPPTGFLVTRGGPVVIVDVTLVDPEPVDYQIDGNTCVGAFPSEGSCFIPASFVAEVPCDADPAAVVVTTFGGQRYVADLAATGIPC